MTGPLTADTHYMRMLGMISDDPRFLAKRADVPKLDEKGESDSE